MAMILVGLAARPEIWRLAAPLAVAQAVDLPGLRLVASRGGPWAVAVAGADVVAGVSLQAGEAEGAMVHLLRGLGFFPVDGVWLGQGADLGQNAGPVPALRDQDLAVLVVVAQDILALHGQVAPEAIAARLGPMLVRAASRLRAEADPPSRLRRRTAAGDVMQTAIRQPYAHFFAIEEHDVAWRRFDGTMSAVATRAAFLSGDAVTVLPYDPLRDRVLVIEQFRAGPLARGDRGLWQIEAIAGRVDPFETPEEAARREAVEEAGLALADLEFVARYYPSPGAVSEYIYSYVALTDLPDGSAGVFGVEDEAEDIRGHLLGFDDLMALVASGEIDNAPLTLTALWLQRERRRLRGSN